MRNFLRRRPSPSVVESDPSPEDLFGRYWSEDHASLLHPDERMRRGNEWAVREYELKKSGFPFDEFNWPPASTTYWFGP